MAGMEIVAHRDVGEFARIAGPLLESDPTSHTIELTALAGVAAGDPAAVLLTVHEGGAVVGSLTRNPARPALVSAIRPRDADAVEKVLADVDPQLPGVNGPDVTAEAFAAAYTARTGAAVRVERRSRLFRLGELQVPNGVPGAARRAAAADLDLLGAWFGEFCIEAHGHPNAEDPREVMARSQARGSANWLWELDGVPVAFASAREPIAGMSRIGPVYTPPQHRGHGYGAAVTAAGSRWALDGGAQRVLLFTDLANPVSNRLYPRIGYLPVHDAVELVFED